MDNTLAMVGAETAEQTGIIDRVWGSTVGKAAIIAVPVVGVSYAAYKGYTYFTDESRKAAAEKAAAAKKDEPKKLTAGEQQQKLVEDTGATRELLSELVSLLKEERTKREVVEVVKPEAKVEAEVA